MRNGSTAAATPTLTSAAKDTKYAWVPVLADNSGAGEETDLNYTFNSSVARQTKVTAATSVTDSSPWTASGMQEESTDRDASTSWNEAGSYHEYVWAKYEFKKTSITFCNHIGCTTTYSWTPDHWAGSLSSDNTDTPCNGCSGTVGAVAYKQPAMPSNKNFYRTLSAQSSHFERSTGQYQSYGFDLDFAGFVDVNSETTHGSITDVNYKLNSSTKCGHSEILWGKAADVTATDIVQANCGTIPS